MMDSLSRNKSTSKFNYFVLVLLTTTSIVDISHFTLTKYVKVVFLSAWFVSSSHVDVI